jgi:hypothetical protein
MGLIISYSSSDADDQFIYLRGFCEQILKTDYFIRSAIIVDHLGHIIASAPELD